MQPSSGIRHWYGRRPLWKQTIKSCSSAMPRSPSRLFALSLTSPSPFLKHYCNLLSQTVCTVQRCPGYLDIRTLQRITQDCTSRLHHSMTSPDTRRQLAVFLGPCQAFFSCTALHHHNQKAKTPCRAGSMQTGAETGGAVSSPAATAAAAAGRRHSQQRPPQPHPPVDVRRSGGAAAAAGVSPSVRERRHALVPPWLLR